MGYTKDLWTRPAKNPDGSVKVDAKGNIVREPNSRYGKGKRWLACWSDPDGNEPSKAFANKVAATKHWQAQETDVERGDYRDPKSGKELFADIAKRWLRSRNVDPSTKVRYEQVYRLHVEPVFGKRQVKAIRPSEIQEFLTGLRYGDSTVGLARLVLGGVLELALADDTIKRNPVRSSIVSTGRTPQQKIMAWTDQRVFAVIDAHPEHLRSVPTVGAACGLRAGELFGLAEEDIDDDVVHVRRQLKYVDGAYLFALPKNDSERDVPLPQWAAQAIRLHVAKWKPETVTLPWETPEGKPATHRLLFRHDDKHLSHNNYDPRIWRPALVKAKVIPEPTRNKRHQLVYATGRKNGAHQLRHFYASVQLAAGTTITSLAVYLGHHDPAYTLRVYGHLQPDSHERARKAIDDRMFRPHAVADGT